MLPGRPFEFNCCSVSDYEKGGVLKVEDFERKARLAQSEKKELLSWKAFAISEIGSEARMISFQMCRTQSYVCLSRMLVTYIKYSSASF